MLILTRKPGEAIRINDEIEISVLSVQGQSVKLGVKAPRAVTVHRQEVYEKIVEENRRAATPVNIAHLEKLVGLGGSAHVKE